MTDLHEKAEQRLKELRWLEGYGKGKLVFTAQQLEIINDELRSIRANFADLAREVALQQADKVTEKLGLELLAKGDTTGWSTCDDAGHRIRSLDPDAAQALESHNEKLLREQMDRLDTDFARQLGDAQRRARLDEAKWWAESHQRGGYGHSAETCEYCQRIAALAESQPAPAKEGEK